MGDAGYARPFVGAADMRHPAARDCGIVMPFNQQQSRPVGEGSFHHRHLLRRKYSGQAGQLVNEFYVPVLKETVRYNRQAGYFDSASLVQIAEGVAAFIRNIRARPEPPEAPMRVVTGATWSPEDAAAYEKGTQALRGHPRRDR